MITLYNTLTIDQPVDKVFRYVNTLENLPQWNPYVLKVELVKDSKTPRLYHQVLPFESQYFRVKAAIPGQLLIFETIEGSKKYFKRSIELSTENGKTVLKDRFEAETPLPGLLESLFTKSVNAMILKNLTKLKELLETGETTLINGRHVELQPLFLLPLSA